MNKENVYKIVTNRIIDSLISGVIPWRQTWIRPVNKDKSVCTNALTGKGYSLLNCLLLGAPGEYASFKQIKQMKGTLRKGSKSRMVIYWGSYIPKDRKDEAKRLEEEGKSTDHLKVFFPKYYNVFSMDDVEGIELKKADEPRAVAAEDPVGMSRLVIRDYTRAQQVELVESTTDEPHYNAPLDCVILPPKDCFTYEEDYLAALFAGLAHSTAAPDRLNREKEYKRMIEDETSTKEELVAEIASSMLLLSCGLKRQETHQQIDAACQKWIQAMSTDSMLVIQAVNAAEKASKYILGDKIHQEDAEETEDETEEATESVKDAA